MQVIFGNLDRWPPYIDRNPLLLTINNLNDFDKFNDALEAAFETYFRRHHALDDAKANLAAWKAAGGTWR